MFRSKKRDKELQEKKRNEELLRAARVGTKSRCEELLSEGANINYKDSDGQSSIWIAACYGRLDVVKLLLQHGAEVNSRTNLGSTPISTAAYNGHYEISISTNL